MLQNKLKIINDPVHGFVKIPFEIIFDIIEHPYFQRLRRIKQTGLLSLIFPGAQHTRFHHAIGAMHLMNLALETLKSKKVKISEKEHEAALIAILLHDIGHGPFSHALENQFLHDWHHEKISLQLMSELNTLFSGRLSIAIEIFCGKYQRQFFNQLISSQLDVDRLDYLKRDSFYTGVAEGNINTDRIISMLNVVNDELVVDEKGIYSIENYLTARMLMYWQVYFHKTSALAEHILVKIVERAKFLAQNRNNQFSTPQLLQHFLSKPNGSTFSNEDLGKFMHLDDTDLWQAMKSWQFDEDFVLSYYCKTVIDRKLPKTLISSKPFKLSVINEKIAKTNLYFKISEGHQLVGEISRSLLAYQSDHQSIKLLKKNSEIINLEDSDNQIITKSISSKRTQYILFFPREILY